MHNRFIIVISMISCGSSFLKNHSNNKPVIEDKIDFKKLYFNGKLSFKNPSILEFISKIGKYDSLKITPGVIEDFPMKKLCYGKSYMCIQNNKTNFFSIIDSKLYFSNPLGVII